jgi:hypothetical protein
MRRIVTMTAYRRPDYTRTVLKALAKCEGISEWTFLPQLEPGHEEVRQAFTEWSASPMELIVNKDRLGLNRNTHAALSRAYSAGATVLVHLEDDTVPSPDALHWFQSGLAELASEERHSTLLVSGYNRPDQHPPTEHHHLWSRRPIWTPWGWAVDRGRLGFLLEKWCFKNPKCFTCIFRYRYRRTRKELFPLLSRIQNIGYELGENDRSPAWYRENHRTPWVADMRELRPFRAVG